jgi:hypothetical protein
MFANNSQQQSSLTCCLTNFLVMQYLMYGCKYGLSIDPAAGGPSSVGPSTPQMTLHFSCCMCVVCMMRRRRPQPMAAQLCLTATNSRWVMP